MEKVAGILINATRSLRISCDRLLWRAARKNQVARGGKGRSEASPSPSTTRPARRARCTRCTRLECGRSALQKKNRFANNNTGITGHYVPTDTYGGCINVTYRVIRNFRPGLSNFLGTTCHFEAFFSSSSPFSLPPAIGFSLSRRADRPAPPFGRVFGPPLFVPGNAAVTRRRSAARIAWNREKKASEDNRRSNDRSRAAVIRVRLEEPRRKRERAYGRTILRTASAHGPLRPFRLVRVSSVSRYPRLVVVVVAAAMVVVVLARERENSFHEQESK